MDSALYWLEYKLLQDRCRRTLARLTNNLSVPEQAPGLREERAAAPEQTKAGPQIVPARPLAKAG